MEILTACLLIFVFACVQSVLGIGLLVFGTPTFMLLGYSFPQTLAMVLPPSIIISLLSLWDAETINAQFRREFNYFCLPFVLLGLVITLVFEQKLALQALVGSMLLFSALIRTSTRLEHILHRFFQKNRKLYQVVMGSIHGLTNMGGGLLSLYAATINRNHKANTRNSIAYDYFIMGCLQFGVLVGFDRSLLSWHMPLAMAVAALAYFLLGRRLFQMTHEKIYKAIISFTILFYGLLLLTK